jgi:hypothetical protein
MGTFRLVNGQKQGGNVVSYFTLPSGTVLHALAGPVDASELLREARWVLETRKMGIARSHGNMKRYKSFWRDAHAERLQMDQGFVVSLRNQAGRSYSASGTPWEVSRNTDCRSLNLQSQVHWLLAQRPLSKLDQISDVVFEQILGQRVSALPVMER